MIKKKLVIPTISWVNKHTRSSISHHSHFHEFNGKKYDFQINSVDYNAQIQWLFFFSHAISIFEYKLLFMCLAVDLCCMCHRILKIVAFFCMAFCHFIGKPTKTFNRLTESTTYANSVFLYIYYSYNVFKLYTWVEALFCAAWDKSTLENPIFFIYFFLSSSFCDCLQTK